jgi:hypothetical protein
MDWLKINQTTKHADLIRAIRWLKDQLPISVRFVHIDGHQDRTTAVQDLPRLTQLNRLRTITARGAARPSFNPGYGRVSLASRLVPGVPVAAEPLVGPLLRNPYFLAGVGLLIGAVIVGVLGALIGMAVDWRKRRCLLGNGMGGLSGPAIHPIAVRMVHDVYRAVAKPAGIPIIGLGGVLTWQDAAEFILVGASAVGVGTALFVDPRKPVELAHGLAAWLHEQRAARVADLVGAMEG